MLQYIIFITKKSIPSTAHIYQGFSFVIIIFFYQIFCRRYLFFSFTLERYNFINNFQFIMERNKDFFVFFFFVGEDLLIDFSYLNASLLAYLLRIIERVNTEKNKNWFFLLI